MWCGDVERARLAFIHKRLERSVEVRARTGGWGTRALGPGHVLSDRRIQRPLGMSERDVVRAAGNTLVLGHGTWERSAEADARWGLRSGR